MWAGILLTLVAMATLPSPSIQTLKGCSYAPADVHVVFEASTLSTQFLGGIRNYLDQVELFVLDAKSTNPDTRVSVTAFTDQGPSEYVSIDSSVSQNQIRNIMSGVTTTARAGVVSETLAFLVNKNIRSTANGNPITLVLIFTSPLSSTAVVRDYVNRLSAVQDIDVRIFPVGILAYNSASTIPFVFNILGNSLGFSQFISDNSLQCNGSVSGRTSTLPVPISSTETPGASAPGAACSNWHGGETLLFPYPGRCDKYYQCSEDGPHEQTCPMGYLYDADRMACDHPSIVLQSPVGGCDYCAPFSVTVHPFSDSCELYYQCEQDEYGPTLTPRCCLANQGFQVNRGCQSGVSCAARNYTDPASCRSYYQCAGGELVSQCCPGGQRFDPHLGYCIVGETECSVPCGGEQPACMHTADPESPCNFLTPDHTRTHKRRCPERQAWDATVCSCSNRVPGADTCLKELQECKLDFLTDMNDGGQWGFNDNSGTWKYVGNVDVVFLGGYGVFQNSAYLTVYHYQNIDWPYPVWVRVTFQYFSSSSSRQVLVSNGCYNADPGQATLFMTVNPAARTLSAGIKTNSTDYSQSLRWNFATSSATWLVATMRYDGQSLDLNIKDRDVTSSSTSESVQAEGEIARSPCAVRIGRGNRGEPMFTGNIDEVSIYATCQSPPAADV
ncbi:uncharacterized protein LOC124143235 [Haliotis rufescens]|uniref:uncharacterized protein LOC124143235 n=1 Tax=Haliotis rufescens TaxID=6454 RepID=UPI001EB085DF|nr:uncharacterized protein LOC124143235 [Haliotis rufescens]XP_046368072.1 uncharacterized protein LOC124143235 [Haliotis rufescens]